MKFKGSLVAESSSLFWWIEPRTAVQKCIHWKLHKVFPHIKVSNIIYMHTPRTPVHFIMYPLQCTVIQEPQVYPRHLMTKVMGWLQGPSSKQSLFSTRILQCQGASRKQLFIPVFTPYSDSAKFLQQRQAPPSRVLGISKLFVMPVMLHAQLLSLQFLSFAICKVWHQDEEFWKWTKNETLLEHFLFSFVGIGLYKFNAFGDCNFQEQ